MPNTVLAIGVDGARGGWLAVTCHGTSPDEVASRRTTITLAPAFAGVAALSPNDASETITGVPVCVDIPMGLLEAVALRPCDRQAQDLLGLRRSTVFAPPSRRLLEAATYAAARDRIAELRKTNPEAKGVSAQAFGLAPKMKEVDDWLRENSAAQKWLWECHPELSFRAMNEGEILAPKKSAHGQLDRLRLVEREFPDVLAEVQRARLPASKAELSDVLDAYAALESALHVAANDYEQLGGETDSAGLIMRMVF